MNGTSSSIRHVSQPLSFPEKGFILGTIDKTSDVFSISSSPRVHASVDLAQEEGVRLLRTGAVSSARRIVVLEVNSYIELPSKPYVIT